MFRADARFGVVLPPVLAHQVGDAAHFRAVEATSPGQIWLLEVQDGSEGRDVPGRIRRLFVADLAEALQLLGLAQWAAANLYILVPAHLSASGSMVLELCKAVWECSEAEDDQACWRVETDQGAYLESLYNTLPGHETKRHLVWAASKRVVRGS